MHIILVLKRENKKSMKRKTLLTTLLLVFAMLLPLMMVMPPTAKAAHIQELDWQLIDHNPTSGCWNTISNVYWESTLYPYARNFILEAEPDEVFCQWSFDLRMENYPYQVHWTHSYLTILFKGINVYTDEYTEFGCVIALHDRKDTDYYVLYSMIDGEGTWRKETSDQWLDINFFRVKQGDEWVVWMNLDGVEVWFYDYFVYDLTLEQSYIAEAPDIPPMEVNGWENNTVYTSSAWHTLTLSNDDPDMGYTTPPAGVYEILEDDEPTLTAFAYSGYEFHYWLINGETNQANPLYLLMMSGDQSVVCHFKSTSGGGGGGGGGPPPKPK